MLGTRGISDTYKAFRPKTFAMSAIQAVRTQLGDRYRNL